MSAPDFDPLDDAFSRDPHPTWARLRRERPVARGGRWDFWALTRYADVKAASRRPAVFTSAQGVTVPRNPVSGRRAPLHFDPPEHARYRRPLNAVLAPERVAALEPRIRRVAADLVEGLVAEPGDAVTGLSSPLAALVFALFVALPADRALELNRHSERFERAQADRDQAVAEAENQYLYAVFRELVAERRAAPLDPREDVVSALLELRIDGRSMDDAFVAGSVRQLLIAAHVAPKAALASAVRHLAEDGALQDRLRGEPALIADAVEELLRLYTPNQGFSRTTSCDTELGGQRIRAGEQVALVLTAANRDPDVFADPDRFVLGRTPNPHIAFGHGAHKCPGQAAARTQMRVALEELLARTASFELAGTVVPDRWPLYGPQELPIRCRAAG